MKITKPFGAAIGLLLLMGASGASFAASRGRVSIHNDSSGKTLLLLCSRAAPPEYDGRWAITEDDVRKVERLLVQAHGPILRNAHITAAQFTQEWMRDYAGFTRRGVKYIYGSFGRESGDVCDGGPSFFGVEFQMPSGKVTHAAYNGLT